LCRRSNSSSAAGGPALRGPRTLEMLAELTRRAGSRLQARDELAESYRWLRTIEHRLQMRHDEQTQTLPKDAADLEAFARFCGYPSTAAFGKALTAHAKRVEGHYALLFEEGPSLASEAGTLSFTGTELDPDTLETLGKLGFRDAKATRPRRCAAGISAAAPPSPAPAPARC
jgi:glutamate-ammonia-ligase adenylyltransferase